MNKIILTSHAALDGLSHLLQNTLNFLASHGLGFLGGKLDRIHRRDHGPRWQQLELPLSRTPVKRWDR